jgi:hypothetical protein
LYSTLRHHYPNCVSFDIARILQWWDILGKLIFTNRMHLSHSLYRALNYLKNFTLGRSQDELLDYDYEIHKLAEFSIIKDI